MNSAVVWPLKEAELIDNLRPLMVRYARERLAGERFGDWVERVLWKAKPDDLRVFLEEAAGVTRYKERRKETEHRLADTRENLARVNDIRIELGAQIEKLEGQAKVASRYKELQQELQLKQHLLWFLRRNEVLIPVTVEAQ